MKMNDYCLNCGEQLPPCENCEKLRAEIEAARSENTCDACAGTGKPISGKPCMCGGSGKMSDAAKYLRKEVFRLSADDSRGFEKLRTELEKEQAEKEAGE